MVFAGDKKGSVVKRKNFRRLRRGLSHVLARFGYKLTRIDDNADCFTPLLRVVLEAVLAQRHHEPLRVVQVGANDGVTLDPLAEFLGNPNVEALLIEPHPAAFASLERNHQGSPRIRTLRAAIGAPDLRLYSVAEEWRSEFEQRGGNPDRKSSSNSAHVARWVEKRMGVTAVEAARRVSEVDVEFVPLAAAIKLAQFSETFEVLQVDAEGFDDQIILSTDLDFHRVFLVHYETANLNSERVAQLSRHLVDLGFKIYPNGPDSFAVRHSILA